MQWGCRNNPCPCNDAKPAYMPSMAIRVRSRSEAETTTKGWPAGRGQSPSNPRTENRSVWIIHEESWPQRSCFGSRPGCAPVRSRRRYRGKSTPLEALIKMASLVASSPLARASYSSYRLCYPFFSSFSASACAA